MPEESADATAPLVELDDLHVRYDTGRFGPPPVRAVDGVSLAIERGETLGLVGESGCGKTTLARALVGLETPTEGAVRVGGEPLAERSAAERRAWQREAAIVFQDPDASLDDRMTLGETIREPLDAHDWPTLALAVEGWDGPLEVRGGAVVAGGAGDAEPATTDASDPVTPAPAVFARVDSTGSVDDVRVPERLPFSATDLDVARVDGPEGTLTLQVSLDASPRRLRRERVRGLLSDVGLSPEFETRYPHELSGGQRQRVAIARALALDPSLLVLDEPLTALDASVQAGILDLLADLQAELGLTYLLVAHDLRVVRHVCDRVAVMYLGQLMEVAPTGDLFDAPANPYSRALLSAIPDPDPTSERERITLRGSPPSARDPPEGCPFATRCPVAIRPAEVDLASATWARIDAFREVIRERSRGGDSLGERLRRRLGLEAGPDDVDAVRADLLGDVDLPDEAARAVDTAVERAAAGDDAAAREVLRETFGSVCDRETPGLDSVDGANRWSRCHRHDEEYGSVAEAFEARASDAAGDGE